MAVSRRAITILAIATAVAFVAGFGGAACGGSDAKSDSGVTPARFDELAARVQRNQMLNAVLVVAGLPLHQMDESAQGGKIDNKYLPTVRTLVRVTALTDWSPELHDRVTKLHDDAVKVLQALDAGNDVTAVKPLSQAAHEDWHTFIDAAWDVVAKDLPADAGGPRGNNEQDSSGNESPSNQASMTPMAGATP